MFRHSRQVLAVTGGGFALLRMVSAVAFAGGPTAEDYVAAVGNGAKIVDSGRLSIDGRVVACGSRSTVLDETLDDFAAAYPGFLILNPKLMQPLKTSVKLWIYSHECAHQFRGPDETVADCFAVQRGRRAGWLTPAGIEDICNFIQSSKGDSMHFAGPQRCDQMRQCYGDNKVY